jgi:hypothetical protein
VAFFFIDSSKTKSKNPQRLSRIGWWIMICREISEIYKKNKLFNNHYKLSHLFPHSLPPSGLGASDFPGLFQDALQRAVAKVLSPTQQANMPHVSALAGRLMRKCSCFFGPDLLNLDQLLEWYVLLLLFQQLVLSAPRQPQ